MSVIACQWPVSSRVSAVVTTRAEGNLARHVGDAGEALANRDRLAANLGLASQPLWMDQVHGSAVVTPETVPEQPPRADAAYTRLPGQPLAVLVADCLPVFLATRSGEEIGVAHAGWRGLAQGVIHELAGYFEDRDICAWLGPAIGPCHYEVDEVVRDQFRDGAGFVPGRDASHWMMDLYAVARYQLAREGIGAVYGGEYCTWCDRDGRFFSHRRGGASGAGRIAALIWTRRGA